MPEPVAIPDSAVLASPLASVAPPVCPDSLPDGDAPLGPYKSEISPPGSVDVPWHPVNAESTKTAANKIAAIRFMTFLLKLSFTISVLKSVDGMHWYKTCLLPLSYKQKV